MMILLAAVHVSYIRPGRVGGAHTIGAELARTFFTGAALVGAAMCSAFECGSHDRWPYALRGSGPDQTLAFKNAMARVGCPDRRIDRPCIACCSPSQPSHHAGCPARSRLVPPAFVPP